MNAKELREILENIQSPSQLDTHPWVSAHFVQKAGAQGSPGEKLVDAVLAIFRETMPGVPPRRGLRLDTRWAEFGLLAAQYFAPLAFGVVVPGSLRSAWAQIDRAILLFVFGRADGLATDQIETYKLIGDESSVAPDSTLSDWHRKGIARLAETIKARELYLSQRKDEVTEESSPVASIPKFSRTTRKWVVAGVLVAILGLIVWGGIKIRRTYDMAMVVRDDVYQLRDLAKDPSLDNLKNAGLLISKTHQDFSVLKAEVEPFLWMAPLLGWVPAHGGDIASSPELIRIADSMLVSADMAYQAGAPLLDDVVDPTDGFKFEPQRLIGLMNQIQPEMIDASGHLQNALNARERLDVEQLSPRVRELITGNVDPFLGLMRDALTLAVELPRIAGGSDEGPKTYLLLVQNEDELRPTGGFITAAGTALVQNGKIGNLTFEDSGNLDDWENPYPSAPWQLSEYMNNPVMVFRDSNWYVDFPKSALYAEYFYSYNKGHSVDGVIAFDQQFLINLLRLVGPVEVEGVETLITADNVVEYMRASKTPNAEEAYSPDWNSKVFIGKLGNALITKFFSQGSLDSGYVDFALQVLNERHLLVQFDNAGMTSFLERHGWDGAIKSPQGDFLMVVDSNIGYNKSNALVETSLEYQIDLRNPAVPIGQVTIEHKNNSSSLANCDLRAKSFLPGEKDYPIDGCYWDYLRVYTPAGSRLLQANPQSVPATWMLRGDAVPAHMDFLDEDLDGISTYGLLKVVPGQDTVSTKLRYVLPVEILSIRPGTRQVVYHLKVKKQPGTIPIPITIQVSLPKDVVLLGVPNDFQVVDKEIYYEGNLKTDLEFEIVFEVP